MTGNLPPNAYESMTGSLIPYAVVLVVQDNVIVALLFYACIRVIRKAASIGLPVVLVFLTDTVVVRWSMAQSTQ